MRRASLGCGRRQGKSRRRSPACQLWQNMRGKNQRTMDCNFRWCYDHSMPSVPLTVCPTCLARVTSLIVDFATQRRFCQECATTSPNAVRVARKIHEHNMRGTLDEYPIEERLRDLQSDADSPEGLADTPHT